MERVKLDNKRILFNLLPAHVAQHFLTSNPRSMVRAWRPRLAGLLWGAGPGPSEVPPQRPSHCSSAESHRAWLFPSPRPPRLRGSLCRPEGQRGSGLSEKSWDRQDTQKYRPLLARVRRCSARPQEEGQWLL